MSFARRLLGLTLALLMTGAVAQAQTLRSTDDPRNPAPSVNGGTGLFTVYDAQTLRKGEFNFGFWANHFHRDPGDLAIQKYPVNFQIGFSDWLEAFVNFEAHQVFNSGTPALLSGFYLPDVRTKTLGTGRLVVIPGTNSISVLNGDPCGNGGFPGPCTVPGSTRVGPFTARPTGNDTALYPGLGAPVGGILPALPPNVNPSYYPNAPFLARFSANGTGDVVVGGKIRFTGPKNPFGFALIPLVKIPTTRDLYTGLERGRGTGGFDYGVIAALDGRLHRYINLSSNIGFIKKGDPKAENMNLGPLCVGCGVIQGFGRSERALDLPNELRAGIGFDFPLSQYLQLIAEISSTHFVGSRTPSLFKNSPVDLVAGAKIFPTRWIAISAAYQRHLNWFSDIDSIHGPDGFIAGLSIGHYNKREEPVLPNQPPTVALGLGNITKGSDDLLRESATTVCAGDKVQLQATASDPDGDTLLYSWTSTGGRIVGDGDNAKSFDTTGLAPGDYTVTVEVNDGCGCVAFDSKTIRVTSCPPLTVCFGPNLDLNPSATSVDAGEKINFTTGGVTGGRNYGNVRYEWKATAGTITGSGLNASLDTTGVAGGTNIDVTVTAMSDAGNCSASGSTRVSIKTPPPPPEPPKASVLDRCSTFKRNNARVDNACKDVLRNRIIPALQSDSGARVVIVGYRIDEKEKPATLDLQRATNTRDRLADGNLGTAIDANRISVAAGGISTDGSQVTIWLVPAGAETPQGVTTVDAGPVTPEKKAPARRKRR